MKILHIGKYYPPYWGGIEKVNHDIVETLNDFGYNVDVLCFNNSLKTETEVKRNYQIIRTSTITSAFSSPISTSIFITLRKIYKDYDIIHLHLPNPMGALALQSIPYKGKIVLHWHSDIINQRLIKKFYCPFQRKLLERADKIIVTSPNYLEGSKDLAPYKGKCEIIPIGISNNEFPPNESFRIQLNNTYKNKKVIFSIGRLIYYKGFEYLIQAAKLLPDDYIILIGGTGILDKKLSKIINDNLLQEKVKLLGNIPFKELGEYYKRADVFCLPSTERSEAFGVVLIEAMSFGCPIISTNISGSGVPWVNKNNETGIVVEPRSPDALSIAIKKILNTPTLLEKYSKGARERYNEIYTLDKMCLHIIKLYNKILE